MIQFLVFSCVLALSSAFSFVFVLGLLLYLLFFKLEFKKRNRVELECILFVTFLTLWLNAILYKSAFLFHSYDLIWRNLPAQVLSEYFVEFDIVTGVTGVGLLTLLFGVFAVYRYMFTERDKRTYLLMAFAVSVAALLWFRLLSLVSGLIFLGAILAPLFGQALDSFFRYVDKSRAASFSWLFVVLFLVVLVLTSFLPSFARASEAVSETASDEEVSALLWLRENSPEGSVVLSTIDEGFFVSAVAGRKNVVDSDFILIRNSDIVFDDVSSMYTAFFKTNAVELLSAYGVDYIYLSGRAREEFGIEGLKYVEKDCFRQVYGHGHDDVKIYEVLCSIG